MDIKTRRKINAFVRYVILVLVGVIMLYPLFWLFSATFKENHEIFTSAGLWPENGLSDWSAWGRAWHFNTGYTFWDHFMNSLKFLVPRTIFTILSSIVTGYAVARFNFKGKKIVFMLIIATLLMPNVIFMIPLYLFWNALGLINTPYPLWVDALFATNSFFVFMMIQFYRTIPRELDEASIVDGCNSLQTLFYILVPILKPIVITVGVLTFMWGMNDYLGPLIYITRMNLLPLSVALRTAIDAESSADYSKVYAMSFLAIIPALAIFGFAQRYFIDGVATTGSKG
ncbi:oligogalacturonide ABC transporter membrane protein [Natranaerovirga hydrolytica]|uniref:Oligogalacturonide ABC transporter membrane protein n=1 Tax=Natranaerovirga hydrolytica TaxID=680378 RepID=A0A4R1M869_9FIRM|nr:carbohydrate ABC transporter permease [Natranaerovirga hydrolytica]TCK87987.1 oligogalacturonide ABC transporter membrane protein [Natranaerovirga hydrolytica]